MLLVFIFIYLLLEIKEKKNLTFIISKENTPWWHQLFWIFFSMQIVLFWRTILSLLYTPILDFDNVSFDSFISGNHGYNKFTAVWPDTHQLTGTCILPYMFILYGFVFFSSLVFHFRYCSVSMVNYPFVVSIIFDIQFQYES